MAFRHKAKTALLFPSQTGKKEKKKGLEFPSKSMNYITAKETLCPTMTV